MTTKPGRVLLTGCSSGLGRAASLAFAQAGWTVYATVRDPGCAEGLGGSHGGGEVLVLPLDVCRDGDAEQTLAAAARLAGEPDVVVHNAGVELVGPVESLSSEELRWQLDANVIGAVRLVRAALPAMRRRGSGRLIFVSSVVGRAARPLLGGYCASKFALEGLVEALYLETLGFGVHVSLLEPGRFPSRLSANRREAAAWRTNPENPYAAVQAALPGLLAALEPGGYEPDTATVAQALVGLATMATPPLRLPVGADTARALELIAGGFSRYAAAYREPGELREPS